MKRILPTVSAFAATLLIASLPVIAEEGSMGRMMEQGQQDQKNECLLASLNCREQTDSIQQRIDRLQGEIARGRDVYSDGELRVLNQKLEDANKEMDFIMNNGGA